MKGRVFVGGVKLFEGWVNLTQSGGLLPKCGLFCCCDSDIVLCHRAVLSYKDDALLKELVRDF